MAEGLAENADFYELTYLDPDSVSLGQAYEAIAPLLWLKAGAVGACIPSVAESWLLPDKATYGVLFDPGQWRAFVEAVQNRRDVTHAFVVTGFAGSLSADRGGTSPVGGYVHAVRGLSSEF